MARANGSPVDYWLSLRLRDLRLWVNASNEVTREIQEQIDQNRAQNGRR